jgi:hypothetical protein
MNTAAKTIPRNKLGPEFDGIPDGATVLNAGPRRLQQYRYMKNAIKGYSKRRAAKYLSADLPQAVRDSLMRPNSTPKQYVEVLRKAKFPKHHAPIDVWCDDWENLRGCVDDDETAEWLLKMYNSATNGSLFHKCHAGCGVVGKKLKKCCGGVRYCSVACQRAHRRQHKAECQRR